MYCVLSLLPRTRESLFVSNVYDHVTGVDNIRIVVEYEQWFQLRFLVELLNE